MGFRSPVLPDRIEQEAGSFVICIVMMSTMRETHLSSLDLNLLVPLHALLEERQITRAATRSYLSQPAMSRALERLRRMFGDSLLVRSGRSYERTVRGERILRELETLLPRLLAMVRGTGFDPAKSEERFRIALTDHASTVLLPPVVARLRQAAPRAAIDVAPWRTEAYEDTAAGRIDTALSAEEAPPVLESEVIFKLDFVCLVGSAQRIRGDRLTLKDYLGFPHVLVETLGGQQTLVERPLSQLGLKRRVALSLPYFLPAMHAVAQTDMVLTLPRRLAKRALGMAGVRVVQPPREIPEYPYFMAWHPRLTDEPAHNWFREQLRMAARKI